MIRIKRTWAGERLFPLSELVKQTDFPLSRTYSTVYRWCLHGAHASRRILVEFPHIWVSGTIHSTVPAANEFIAEMAKRHRPVRKSGRRLYSNRRKVEK